MKHLRILLFAKVVIFYAIASVLPLVTQGQNSTGQHLLSEYRKWSIFAGPVIYDRAVISPQYGDYTFTNKPIIGFNAGFEYDFYPGEKWSVITGLYTAREPIGHLSYQIFNNDLYMGSIGDLTNEKRIYSMLSFSAPILLRLNIMSIGKSCVFLTTGLKVSYFPYGGYEMVHRISNMELSESREVFGLKLESPKNYYQGSFMVGAGYSYAMGKALLKTRLLYVMNFQNTITGEYQFANLLTSPDTRGYYELSGNYVALWLAISFKKKKSSNIIPHENNAIK